MEALVQTVNIARQAPVHVKGAFLVGAPPVRCTAARRRPLRVALTALSRAKDAAAANIAAFNLAMTRTSSAVRILG